LKLLLKYGLGFAADAKNLPKQGADLHTITPVLAVAYLGL